MLAGARTIYYKHTCCGKFPQEKQPAEEVKPYLSLDIVTIIEVNPMTPT